MLIARKDDIKGSYISYFSNLVKTYGGYNLAQGIPGFDPPAKLLDILASIRAQRAHQYAPGTGNLALLDQLRSRYAGRYDPDQADFFIVNGATEAISLIYTMLYKRYGPDLNCMAFSPAYESYIHLPGIFGNRVIFQKYEEDGGIDTVKLERNIKKNQVKLLFLCSPGNPWGVITNRTTLESLVDICECNACYLIIDAVYDEFYYTGTRPYYPTERVTPYVFYVNSFSKLFSITGWRVGYLLSHHQNMPELRHVHDYIGLSSPAPFQVALAEYLSDAKDQERYVTSVRSALIANYTTQHQRLADHGFSIPRHDGGYFIWARCPDEYHSGIDFAVALYNKTQTAVIPGAHFGKEWDRYIRINMALPSDILKAGVERVCRMAM